MSETVEAGTGVTMDQRGRSLPRIVHVETGRHLFGGARQVLDLLDGLSRRHEYASLLVCAAGSEVERAAREQRVDVHPMPVGSELDPRFPARLWQLLRRERPALVHLHSRRGADTLGALAARLAGTPVVLSRRVPFPAQRWLLRLMARRWDHVIAISEAIAGSLRQAGLARERVTVVPDAVDADRFSRPCSRDELCRRFDLPADTRVVIGIVAQLIERKGHDVLLAALPPLMQREPSLRVLCFGRGPREQALRDRARQLGVAQAVTFVGFLPDMERWIGALDLLVHPARDEGMGVALLEAAAARCPIIATPVGGIPEIVRDGDTGRVVPVDDPPALADAVIAVLEQPEQTRTMVERAFEQVVRRHSIEAMTAGNVAVYERLRCIA
jgi:glycosyltransferase involved in cell wall biosynthesis